MKAAALNERHPPFSSHSYFLLHIFCFLLRVSVSLWLIKPFEINHPAKDASAQLAVEL
jgi:hypothetical protein